MHHISPIFVIMAGAWLAWKDRRKQAVAASMAGLTVFF